MIQISLKKNLQSASGTMPLDINLTIEEHQFVTLYGESGAGKTSILRMIAGLMDPDDGTIKVDGQTWFSKEQKINRKIQARQAGMVFQNYTMFPNMSVFQNIRFAGGTDDQVNDLLEALAIENLKDSKTDKLSGGQQQRVALARAIIQKPKILLLDEPLSALDEKTRYKLQTYLRQIHEQYKLTTVLVSHDVTEMMRLSDKVFMIDQGKIVKEGKPTDVLVNDRISGKFSLTGTILKIEEQDFISILFISAGNQLIKVVADRYTEQFEAGDRVMVASKAFNPVVTKIGS